MELTPENSDGVDCSEPLSQEASDAPIEEAPDYIKERLRVVRLERTQARRKALRRVLDFGIHPAELERLRGSRPTTEAGIAVLIVDEVELAAKGRWAGQAEPPRWVPPSTEKPPKLIAASELFDDGYQQ